MDKIKNNKVIKYIPHISFIIFFFLMVNQFLKVFIYFDDYGFASLSYSNSIKGVNGLHYSLGDLIKFLYLYYGDWGGRVISFGVEALLLKYGVIVMQIAMAITVTIIVYYLYKIIGIYNNKNKWFTAISICSFYGLLHIGMLRDSFYWYTSAVIYVMPFLPYLIGVYYYSNKINSEILKEKIIVNNKVLEIVKNIVIALILFIAAFSQEQVAISLSFLIVALTILKWVKCKKIELWNYINCSATILGTIFVVFAPGNSKRMDEQKLFYSLPLLSRTISNIDSLFKEVFGYKMIYIMTAYVLALALMSIVMIKKNIGYKVVNIIFLVLNSLFFLAFIIKKHPLYNILENRINYNFIMPLIFIYLVFIIVQITIYYLNVDKPILLLLFFASLCTISSMAFIPTITIRGYVPFTILSFGIMADLASDFVDEIKYGIIVGILMLILLVPFSYKNYSIIFDGYKANYTYHISNEKALENVKEQIDNGLLVKSVELKKLQNQICANYMQYDEGYQYIKVWMCEYYDIPQNIEFNWVN